MQPMGKYHGGAVVYGSRQWGSFNTKAQDRFIYATTGRFLPKPVACSKTCANWRTLKSALSRPTICTPTGSPSDVKPPGTEAAGLPVAEMYQQDFIQSI